MKTLARAFVGVILLNVLFTCNAFAQENNVKYSISLVSMSMDYNEKVNGVWKDSEKAAPSAITGYDMSLGYLFGRKSDSVNEIYIDGMVLNGKTAYDGFDQNTSSISIQSTTSNQFTDVSIGYKHTRRIQDRLDFFAGIGLGYHSWDRQLSSIQDELYEWKSIRPSAGMNLHVNRFEVGVGLEYQYCFDTILTASNEQVTYKLGGVDIVKISLPMRYNFSKELEFFAQYAFSSQNIKHSPATYSTALNGWYLEPDSTNYQHTLQLGATFKF
jgi:hypothetical protein